MYYFSALKVNARKVYARITQSHITTSFFVFSFIYCLVQSVLQSLFFSVDIEYGTFVSALVKGGKIPPANFTFLEGHRGHLHLQVCNHIPNGQIPYPCTTIHPPLAIGPVRVLRGWENGLNVTNPSNATNVVGVEINTLDGSSIPLNEQCVQSLLYPSQILRNFSHEDAVWLFLQFWLLTISFFVILHDSVPHTLAALMMRALETGWAAYATWRGSDYQANFQELLADPGTSCSLDLFSAYWRKRHVFEITGLILSSTGLIVFSYLSWKLLKVYNAQSFKCVGAPQHVMRIHKFFMAVLACLQLEAFVLVTSMGLWIMVLTETAIAQISSHTKVYKALYITTMIVSPRAFMTTIQPIQLFFCAFSKASVAMDSHGRVFALPSSLTTTYFSSQGWYSIRREMKRMMVFFLGIAFFISASWSIMFYSEVYRCFMQWPYLGCYTLASFVLLFASMVLGIICRMNFGKGFSQYLHVEATLASMNFAPDSFSHDTRKTDAHLSKELDMKILHLDSGDKYYPSTLGYSTECEDI
ncbi:hypothetical protein BYT27DRAFT_6928724 [Phlegmacium glaucopus]|nr:hypothetical protein BYT27DRAFT_6928724 [Phlegmacium glaucopus]